MAKAVEQLRSGLVVGHAALGRTGQKRDSVVQAVHDGDTVTVETDGNLGVRFLGVDAPEVSVPLPGTTKPFVPIGDQRWQQVLADPFADTLPPFTKPLDGKLRAYLSGLASPELATNHARLGTAATRQLESTVEGDREAFGHTTDDFRFFLAFAGDVMDRYGRLLGYLHPAQPDTPAKQRLDSYNERLLQQAWVIPYFIWPNVDPFRKAPSIAEAVPPPGKAAEMADRDPALRRARGWARDARAQQVGVYDAADPLRLLPFELRYLARRQPPDRSVVDLSSSENRILPPEAYIEIPNYEDRLFIPAEYLPLWRHHGWHLA
jgi:endonuclease YncB( thermonuclease family)